LILGVHLDTTVVRRGTEEATFETVKTITIEGEEGACLVPREGVAEEGKKFWGKRFQENRGGINTGKPLHMSGCDANQFFEKRGERACRRKKKAVLLL